MFIQVVNLLVYCCRHGVSHTEINILNDPALSFNVAYQQYQERMAKEMKDVVPGEAVGNVMLQLVLMQVNFWKFFYRSF